MDQGRESLSAHDCLFAFSENSEGLRDFGGRSPRRAICLLRVNLDQIDHSGQFRLSLNSGSTEDITVGPFRAKTRQGYSRLTEP
jgi:hypothetical protein